jgi:hypothetical protein
VKKNNLISAKDWPLTALKHLNIITVLQEVRMLSDDEVDYSSILDDFRVVLSYLDLRGERVASYSMKIRRLLRRYLYDND